MSSLLKCGKNAYTSVFMSSENFGFREVVWVLMTVHETRFEPNTSSRKLNFSWSSCLEFALLVRGRVCSSLACIVRCIADIRPLHKTVFLPYVPDWSVTYSILPTCIRTHRCELTHVQTTFTLNPFSLICIPTVRSPNIQFHLKWSLFK